jgi:exopolysaccharide biosynthesis protein
LPSTHLITCKKIVFTLNLVKYILCLAFFNILALAQDFFLVPEGLVRISQDMLEIRIPSGGTLTFIPGFGWTSHPEFSPPVVGEEGVYVKQDVATFLGLMTNQAIAPTPVMVEPKNTATPTEDSASPVQTPAPEPLATATDSGPPRITDIRFGGSGSIRVVVDIAGITSSGLQSAVSQGQLQEGSVLELSLPRLELGLEPPEPYNGIDIEVFNTDSSTQLRLTGPKLNYRVFILENPTRLVIDLVPLVFAEVTPESKELRPGIIYKRFAAPSSAGSSGVHVLEIAPHTGEFRVVGSQGQGLPLSQLASGSFAAINAGYFDTQNFIAIGFLKVDYGLLSYPSRNRASIAFGNTAPLIDRVAATINVRINDQLYYTQNTQDASVVIHTQTGAVVGNESKGVIVVSNGQVIENKIGPRQVPSNGFALVYEPDIRDLALVNAGNQAAIEVQFQNPSFANSRYAVEGGPLLVQQGQAAFHPDLEQFDRGERILDQYTQQAVIGLRADGTMLMVTADNMVAADLVQLMMSLGAQSAMRLDSGSSTALYINGKIINKTTPERKVVTAIIFVPY